VAPTGRGGARANRLRRDREARVASSLHAGQVRGQGGQTEAEPGVLLALLYGWGTEGCDMADSQETRVLLHPLEGEQALLPPPGMSCLLPLYLGGLFLNGITQLVDCFSRKELLL
jgi:hypothetical protein